jgi:RimJ/RimL family protein N-acetyltransferase
VAISRYATNAAYRRYLSPTHPGPEEFVAHNLGVDCLVAPEFWGRQIGFEACSAAIEHAFVDLDLSKVVARADSRHDASIRLMMKLGMRSRGVAHRLDDGRPDGTVDEVIYEIIRDEWSRARSDAR